MKHFHERLKHIRKIHGFTQKFVAKKVGLNQSSYNRYENAKFTPSLPFILKIIELYDVNTSWLLLGAGRIMTPTVDKPLNFGDIKAGLVKGKVLCYGFERKKVAKVDFDTTIEATVEVYFESSKIAHKANLQGFYFKADRA